MFLFDFFNYLVINILISSGFSIGWIVIGWIIFRKMGHHRLGTGNLKRIRCIRAYLYTINRPVDEIVTGGRCGNNSCSGS
jgi:hypothetical protein